MVVTSARARHSRSLSRLFASALKRPALTIISAVALTAMVAWLVSPIFARLDTWGAHDWDQMTLHRLLVVRTLREYGQFPAWNPYGCGGHTAWGGPESGTTLLSPWAPLYLLVPVRWALRLEILGATLLGAAGVWAWTSSYVRHPVAKAFAAIVFVGCGRWALQTAAGHTWHFGYGLCPWLLHGLRRAEAGGLAWPAFSGAVVALMITTGAIYPLPQVLVLAGVQAVVAAIVARGLRPLSALAGAAILGVLLGAVKLLPLLECLRRFPRAVSSTERASFREVLAALTLRDQPSIANPEGVLSAWGWHEHGLYVGTAALFVLVAGAALGVRADDRRTDRASLWPERAALLVAVTLGFGAFHPLAPWALLHRFLPVFRSHHVPSRWHYAALLYLALLGAVGLARVLRALEERSPRMAVAGLALLLVVGIDLTTENRRHLAWAFVLGSPAGPEDGTAPFHQERRAPPKYAYTALEAGRDGTPGYEEVNVPAFYANVGIVESLTFPGLSVHAQGYGLATPIGAKGAGEPGYVGEAFVIEGDARRAATITRWSPNEVVVAVRGAREGAQVALNQNYDPGWRVTSGDADLPARSLADVVAAPVPVGDSEVRFAYRPASLAIGAWISAITGFALLLAFAARRARTAATA